MRKSHLIAVISSLITATAAAIVLCIRKNASEVPTADDNDPIVDDYDYDDEPFYEVEDEFKPWSEGIEFASNYDGTCRVFRWGTCYDAEIIVPPISPDGDKVTSIGDLAFWKCPAEKIVLPAGVTSIGDWAFNDCPRLTRITIPESVTSIGIYAFDDCTNLSDITIPTGVTSINTGTFDGCASLTSIVIPDSVTSIGEDAFFKCVNLTSITIPSDVTSIGKRAFWKCPGCPIELDDEDELIF